MLPAAIISLRRITPVVKNMEPDPPQMLDPSEIFFLFRQHLPVSIVGSAADLRGNGENTVIFQQQPDFRQQVIRSSNVGLPEEFGEFFPDGRNIFSMLPLRTVLRQDARLISRIR